MSQVLTAEDAEAAEHFFQSHPFADLGDLCGESSLQRQALAAV
jgi:hypothetical protein